MYAGYQLTDNSKKMLMRVFPPKYSRIFGHHITTKFGTTNPDDIPPDTKDVKVVAYADSGDGIEALIVSIDGNIRREDGKYFHITWSLDPTKYKPVDSNDLVKRRSTKIEPVYIEVIPKLFSGADRVTPYIDRPQRESFINFLKGL